MKILVTGHKGFIGSHLTRALNNKKIEWIGYDLKDNHDIRDKDILKKIFQEHDFTHVIHLAAIAGVRESQRNPEKYITTNINGLYNVLEETRNKNAHFIFFSSSSVVGEQPSPNKETDPLSPESIYGITKATGEQIISKSYENSTIVRPFTVYGENGRIDQILYKWINQVKENKPITVYGDGTTKRGYTYVGDLVDGVISIVNKNQKPRPQVDIFNLGGKEIISLNDAIDIFKKTVPNLKIDQQDLPRGDIKENWADLTKAEKELNYKPNTVFKEKIIEIIKKELDDLNQ